MTSQGVECLRLDNVLVKLELPENDRCIHRASEQHYACRQ